MTDFSLPEIEISKFDLVLLLIGNSNGGILQLENGIYGNENRSIICGKDRSRAYKAIWTMLPYLFKENLFIIPNMVMSSYARSDSTVMTYYLRPEMQSDLSNRATGNGPEGWNLL